MARKSQPTAISETFNWWHEHRPRAGFLRTAGTFLAICWEFVRDSMPDRARQRYGDVDYDWEYRVDTTSANVSWQARFIGLLNSSYQPIESPLFHEMIRALEIDYSQFTFIDIGSGKGRPLLMAAEYPFARIIGIELLPELHNIAKENIRRFPEDQKRCKQIESLQGDAREFAFPPIPSVVFMFHPLPESGFRQVIANLANSVSLTPRPVWLIYANPLYESIVVGSGVFRKMTGTLQYSIFSAGLDGSGPTHSEK